MVSHLLRKLEDHPLGGLVRTADERLAGGDPAASPWSLHALAGRVVELADPGPDARTTVAVGLVLEAQLEGAPCAWVSAADSLPYPPDLADGGVDLEALPIVRATEASAAGRAAEHLLRSDAFGLVILDAGERGQLPPALRLRLVRAAHEHAAVLLALAEGPADSGLMGSAASLRAEASWERLGPDRFACRLRALTDRRRAPGWRHEEVCHGPPGLC